MQQLDIQDGPRQNAYTSQPGRYDDSSSMSGIQSHHCGGGPHHSVGGVNLMHGQPAMGTWFDSDV